MPRILIVEDEAVLSKNMGRSLKKLGHTIAVAADRKDGLKRFTETNPDLVLLDLRLPDGSGLELLQEMLAQDSSVSVVMMTAYATVEDAVRAIRLGAVDYLQKPLSMEDLKHTVARALEEQRLRQEVSYYRKRDSDRAGLAELLGSCEAVVALRGKIERLTRLPASSTPTVLVEGETGTGKGLLVRVLHYNGPRKDRPFIEVNCGAIPENLVEAELFGYTRGAFTDAKTSKVGLFQAAHRGTLFLDEIGSLPLTIQVKILKAIEEKTVRPLGARTEDAIDVQIVAATNSDLEGMVSKGTFREDLFYRIRVATLRLPPLRERGDDVLQLARTFLEELSARYRLPKARLSKTAEKAILDYPWPGNVRELANTLDRAVLFSDTSTIDVAALGLPGRGVSLSMRRSDQADLEIDIPDDGIRFEDVERAMILSGLRKAKGSQSDAARLLGLTRDTLRYRMEKFGIRPS